MRRQTFLLTLILLGLPNAVVNITLSVSSTYGLTCKMMGPGYIQYDSRANRYETASSSSSSAAEGASQQPWVVESLGIDESMTEANRKCFRITRTQDDQGQGPPGSAAAACASVLARTGLGEVRLMYRDARYIPSGCICGDSCEPGCSPPNNWWLGQNATLCDYSPGSWRQRTPTLKCVQGHMCIRDPWTDSVCRCRAAEITSPMVWELSDETAPTMPFGALVQVGDEDPTDSDLRWATTYLGIPISPGQDAALAAGQPLTVCLTFNTPRPEYWGIDLVPDSPFVIIGSMEQEVIDLKPFIRYTFLDVQLSLVGREPPNALCGQQVCSDSFDYAFNGTTLTFGGGGDPFGNTVASVCLADAGRAPQTDGGCVVAFNLCGFRTPGAYDANLVKFCRKNGLTQCPGSIRGTSSVCGYGSMRRYCCSMS